MQNNTSETTRHHFRSLAQLDLIDNFLFQATISQGKAGEEVCRILLRTILGRPFGKVRVVPQKPFLGPDVDRHGIRLDAYIEDWSAFPSDIPDAKSSLQTTHPLSAELCPDIYDIEPNKTSEKQTLPKRMRYYHGLIDSHLLDSGKTYDTLPSVFIITILPYDPFGQNRMVYTIKNCCVEAPDLAYDDGAVKIFLYTKGTEGNPGKELRDMLKYIEETTEQNITNPDIAAIHGDSVGYYNIFSKLFVISYDGKPAQISPCRFPFYAFTRIASNPAAFNFFCITSAFALMLYAPTWILYSPPFLTIKLSNPAAFNLFCIASAFALTE